MNILKRIYFMGILLCLVMTAANCSTKSAASSSMPPNDLLGIDIGMTKVNARERLNEIATFQRDERKRQQVWKLKGDPHFNYIAIGFDDNEMVRYLTAFVDESTVSERIRFTDVGDLSTATKEIVAPHHRYIWNFPDSETRPGYMVSVYGDNPDFLTSFSISKINLPKELNESTEKSEH